MRLTFAALVAIAAPIFAQSTTPAPTTTDGWFGPPWATSDPAKWSSIYNSLVSEGKIPSTLTAPPWPTGSWGPGSGPWGPGGPGPGPGGPGGRHWGGTYPFLYITFKSNPAISQPTIPLQPPNPS
jgi:hypothetical protein